MKNVMVKEIYSVDTISKGNYKAWLRLLDYVEKDESGEDILFDFKSIEVVQPWATPEFKMLMQNERVYIKLWCNETTVNSINIMCRLNGLSGNRAINENIEPEKQLTKEEQQITKMSEELQSFIEDTSDNSAVLNIYKRFDQIGVPITVMYIAEALRKFKDRTGKTDLTLDAKSITIQTSVIENITNLIPDLKEDGINLTIKSNDKTVMNKIGMYRTLANNKEYSIDDKIRLIKSTLRPGKVGMLIKYKNSKATDEFGRKGNGTPVSCRVAIYKGMKKIDNEICVVFTTYNGNTFYTQVHWNLEHDNNSLDKLESDTVKIPVNQFGMYKDFLGSLYHFITPVQKHAEDSMVMYGIDSDGRVTHTKMTIPERIQAVLDDWEIEYDSDSIRDYIEETRKILAENGG